MTTVDEPIAEEATLAWFTELGYTNLHGPTIAPTSSSTSTASPSRSSSSRTV